MRLRAPEHTGKTIRLWASPLTRDRFALAKAICLTTAGLLVYAILGFPDTFLGCLYAGSVVLFGGVVVTRTIIWMSRDWSVRLGRKTIEFFDLETRARVSLPLRSISGVTLVGTSVWSRAGGLSGRQLVAIESQQQIRLVAKERAYTIHGSISDGWLARDLAHLIQFRAFARALDEPTFRAAEALALTGSDAVFVHADGSLGVTFVAGDVDPSTSTDGTTLVARRGAAEELRGAFGYRSAAVQIDVVDLPDVDRL